MSIFSKTAADVVKTLTYHLSTEERDAEWQRVNSAIADILKDAHMGYSKLARLQSDFAGEELARLSKISEATLAIGDELSKFAKAFYEGKYEMLQKEFVYGENGGSPVPNSEGGQNLGIVPPPVASPPAPETELPSPSLDTENSFDVEAKETPVEDFSGEEAPKASKEDKEDKDE